MTKETTVRGKLEEIEARLYMAKTLDGIPVRQETQEEYCACEAPTNENGTCTACGKKINAELNRKDTTIPKPKEELYNG